VNKHFLNVVIVAAALFLVTACNFSTANLSSLKTSTDKEGTKETTSFKAGDTIYANAVVSNAMDKNTVKYALIAVESKTTKTGEVMQGTEVTIDMPGSGTANLTLPVPASFSGGKFNLVADLINEKGEKKDSKSVMITIAPGTTSSTDDRSVTDDKETDQDK